MTVRAKYENEIMALILAPFRPGISNRDHNLANHQRNQLLDAIEIMRVAIEQHNSAAIMPSINLEAFNDFVHDEIQSDAAFDEMLAAKQRG